VVVRDQRFVDYEGRPVILRGEVWQDHNCPLHPEVCNNLEAMDLTIASPHRANFAVGSMTREVLYRRNVLAPPLRRDYLKVVVQYRETSGGETVGYVVSAYAVEAIDPQEAPKWTP
jgi:hypothetical protein